MILLMVFFSGTWLYFRLAGDFCRPESPQSLTLRVVYLDEGDSSWHLSYHSRDGMKKAIVVTNADSGQWREQTVAVVDAAMQHGGLHKSDLILASNGGDTVFHLVEILRADEFDEVNELNKQKSKKNA